MTGSPPARTGSMSFAANPSSPTEAVASVEAGLTVALGVTQPVATRASASAGARARERMLLQRGRRALQNLSCAPRPGPSLVFVFAFALTRPALPNPRA